MVDSLLHLLVVQLLMRGYHVVPDLGGLVIPQLMHLRHQIKRLGVYPPQTAHVCLEHTCGRAVTFIVGSKILSALLVNSLKANALTHHL